MGTFTKTAAVLCGAIIGCGLSVASANAENLWETLPFPTSYPEPSTSGHLDVNGVQIFHAEWGTGDPVILLHGGLGSIEAFANQIPALAESYHVIAIDSRGHGRSTRDDATYSYELMTSDVMAVMDEKNIEKAAFVGWSDGGIISLELAINHPARIEKAFIIGTNYTTAGVDPAVETNAVFGDYVGAAAELYAKNSSTPSEFDSFVNAIVEMWGAQPNYTAAQLQSVSAPITVFHALEDEAILDEHAEELAGLLKGATYLPKEGLSHFAMWQDPKFMNATILEFLK